MLWRIYHGELDHFKANFILLMIGTNNLSENTDEEILDGLEFLTRAIKVRQPDVVITMAGILPRRAGEDRVKTINRKIQWLTYNLEGVQYVDFGGLYLTDEGKVDESLFTDGLHPNAKGYRRLAKEINQLMQSGN